jgi:hypothetical protein
VIAAARVEPGCTAWALIGAVQILAHGQFKATCSAENCKEIPFVSRPNFDSMIGQGIMAFLAGKVGAAALHLDRDNIQGSLVVSAPGLRVQPNSTHLGTKFCHPHRVEPAGCLYEKLLSIWPPLVIRMIAANTRSLRRNEWPTPSYQPQI